MVRTRCAVGSMSSPGELVASPDDVLALLSHCSLISAGVHVQVQSVMVRTNVPSGEHGWGSI